MTSSSRQQGMTKLFQENYGPIRNASCVAVFGPSDSILILLRNNDSHLPGWCMPGGMVEPGERSQDTASRELLEETGLSVPVDALTFVTLQTSSRGVRVAVFAVRLVEKPTCQLSDEHRMYLWASQSNLQDLRDHMAGLTAEWITLARERMDIQPATNEDRQPRSS